jgi:type VI protein secretion system component Hcp
MTPEIFTFHKKTYVIDAGISISDNLIERGWVPVNAIRDKIKMGQFQISRKNLQKTFVKMTQFEITENNDLRIPLLYGDCASDNIFSLFNFLFSGVNSNWVMVREAKCCLFWFHLQKYHHKIKSDAYKF